MTELQRLKKTINWLVFEEKADNEADLAKKMDYNKSSFSQIVNGKVPLSDKFIEKICSLDYNINKNWLRSGEGDMLNTSQPMLPEQEPAPVVLNIAPPGKGYTAVPVADIEAAAGFGTENADYVDQSNLIYFPDTMLRGSGERLCINVAGESMMPTLHEGTQVVVRRLRRMEWEAGITNGNIYVLTDKDGNTYIKRVKNRLKTDGVITLISDNPNQRKYAPFDMTADEMHHVWITELFISDTVVNCAEYVSSDKEIMEVKGRIAELQETVERLSQKVEKNK